MLIHQDDFNLERRHLGRKEKDVEEPVPGMQTLQHCLLPDRTRRGREKVNAASDHSSLSHSSSCISTFFSDEVLSLVLRMMYTQTRHRRVYMPTSAAMHL